MTSFAVASMRGRIDFAARRKQAREDMNPHIAHANAAKAEVVSLKEKLKAGRGNRIGNAAEITSSIGSGSPISCH